MAIYIYIHSAKALSRFVCPTQMSDPKLILYQPQRFLSTEPNSFFPGGVRTHDVDLIEFIVSQNV